MALFATSPKRRSRRHAAFRQLSHLRKAPSSGTKHCVLTALPPDRLSSNNWLFPIQLRRCTRRTAPCHRPADEDFSLAPRHGVPSLELIESKGARSKRLEVGQSALRLPVPSHPICSGAMPTHVVFGRAKGLCIHECGGVRSMTRSAF